jgi:prolyl-tRNA synthetase
MMRICVVSIAGTAIAAVQIRNPKSEIRNQSPGVAVRWSKTFIPTMKENPSDAEIPSHQLMLRAGLIRQLMAGAYTYLPLGWRSVRKAEQIVREEMDRAGAIELFMPALQPIDLFERTGRKEAFGNVLINFHVQRGHSKVHLALGPTHEEVITDLIGRHLNSYRQLPICVYQIQTKFRNEERPRFGVLRTSEFIMKDAYSFGTSLEQLNAVYDQMYRAYCRIFARCGLKFLAVEAESGPIGGDASHEFMVPANNGEDKIVHCAGCGYAANLERAETGRSAPSLATAANAAALQKVATPNAASIEQVSRLLKCAPAQMIKTLIYKADGKPAAVLIRGDHEANEAKIRRAVGAKAIELADEKTIREVTGAPVGFAGPVGIKCPIVADHDIPAIANAVTGANEADAHFTGVNVGRDYQLSATHDLRMALDGDACPKCKTKMKLVHGIEVGHVFKLGTKYSVSLAAEFLDEKEQRHPMIMGCYGIGVNRIVASLAETSFDDNGLIFPLSIAPYEVLVIPLNVTDPDTMNLAESIYKELGDAGVDVLLDDRDARAGFKFKDADLIGIPLRIVIGGKGIKEGQVEVKWRNAAAPVKMPISDAVATVRTMLADRKRDESAAVPA